MWKKIAFIKSNYYWYHTHINQVWTLLKPLTWSEVILRIYIDRLEIQSWLKGEIVPNLISSISMAASILEATSLLKKLIEEFFWSL